MRNHTARDFFWFYFSSILLWKKPGEIPDPQLLIAALLESPIISGWLSIIDRLNVLTINSRKYPLNLITCKCKITIFYYINTNEIPGELSRKNLISSHVKITCYLNMWKYHHCYSYMINCALHTNKLLKWNGLVFHWCLYNE